jgi:hypothetical protein
MAHSAEIPGQTVAREGPPEGSPVRPGPWAALRLIAHRSILWTYERGSWQYDVICAIILAFIFLTPPSWFHDKPTLGLTNLRYAHGVIQLGRSHDGWHYLVDSRLVAAMTPLKPNEAIRQILQERFHRPVQLKSVTILFDKNNVILGYTVVFSESRH